MQITATPYFGQGADTNIVKFYKRAKQDEKATEEQGRPIYNDEVYILIQSPGDRLTTYDQPATFENTQNYPEQYAKFLASAGEDLDGTPLRAWPLMTPALIEELTYFKVETVENVAALSDSALDKIGPGFRKLRDQAKAFLAAALGTADTQRLAAENHEIRQQLENMKRQMADMAAANEELRAKVVTAAPAQEVDPQQGPGPVPPSPTPAPPAVAMPQTSVGDVQYPTIEQEPAPKPAPKPRGKRKEQK